jgi:aminopeptidase 2
LRALVISNLARYEDPETIKTALEKFPKFLEKNDTVVPDLRTTLYSANIAKKREAWEQVFNIFKTTDLNEERIRCLRSLGATQEDDLLDRTLQLSISEEVRSQDSFYVLASAVENPKGVTKTWEFFKTNFETYKTR